MGGNQSKIIIWYCESGGFVYEACNNNNSGLEIVQKRLEKDSSQKISKKVSLTVKRNENVDGQNWLPDI